MTSKAATYICSVDISGNTFNESAKNVLAKMVHSDTTVSLDFSHNSISGELLMEMEARVLQSVTASHNDIAGGVKLRPVKRADLSYNKVTNLHLDCPRCVEYVDLRSNPPFKLTGQLFRPTDEIAVYEAADGNRDRQLLCPVLTQSVEGSDRFLLPAHTLGYKGCRCVKGWGEPPRCKSEPIRVTTEGGSLPEAGKSVFGERTGLSAQWLIQPESTARAIYLNFTRFRTIAHGQVRVDVFLGNVSRGDARVLSYSLEQQPKIGQDVLAGNMKGTSSTVLVNFETSSTESNEPLIAFNYRATKACPHEYVESKQSKQECIYVGRECNAAKGEKRLQGGCLVLQADTSVSAKSISHALHKFTADWTEIEPKRFEPTIQISPRDKFSFTWKLAALQLVPKWLRLTARHGVVSNGGNGNNTSPRLQFVPEGLYGVQDGQSQSATLQFEGSVLSNGAAVAVKISNVTVLVAAVAIPSLLNSSLKLIVNFGATGQRTEHLWQQGQAIEASEGSSVDAVLMGVDHDGLALTLGARSFTMTVEDGREGEFRAVDLKFNEGAYQARILSSAQPGMPSCLVLHCCPFPRATSRAS